MYFKVGDVVTVREDLIEYGLYYMQDKENRNAFCGEMCKFAGEKVTISEISDMGQYEVKELIYVYWTDEMFEEYDSHYDTYEEKLAHSITIDSSVCNENFWVEKEIDFHNYKDCQTGEKLYTQKELDLAVEEAILEFKNKIMRL